MHSSLTAYLDYLLQQQRSPLTIKASKLDLDRFVRWWEITVQHTFSPELILPKDIYNWRVSRQRDDGAAPATINRALSALRGYCRWAVKQALIPANPTDDIAQVTIPSLAPRSVQNETIDMLLRAGHQETNSFLRVRGQAIMGLLVYAGLRVQELCDLQIRDLDLLGGTLTVRQAKAGKYRRIPLHKEAFRYLHTYIKQIRCPQGPPDIGSSVEKEALFVHNNMTLAGQPTVPGLSQRTVQRFVKQLGQNAIQLVQQEIQQEEPAQRVQDLEKIIHELQQITPHQLRHSLAKRMLKRGIQINDIQKVLGHSRLSTTGIYLTSSEDDLRNAIDKSDV